MPLKEIYIIQKPDFISANNYSAPIDILEHLVKN
jgi:hypothetical protein